MMPRQIQHNLFLNQQAVQLSKKEKNNKNVKNKKSHHFDHQSDGVQSQLNAGLENNFKIDSIHTQSKPEKHSVVNQNPNHVGLLNQKIHLHLSERVQALNFYAGSQALAHIRANGLSPSDVRIIPAAAGGPKGLILGALDRFLFGEWLLKSRQEIHLLGASIGAWRVSTACVGRNQEEIFHAFARLERDYIAQNYEPEAGKTLNAQQVSERFQATLQNFYSQASIENLLEHPRYRLHIFTSRGRGLLRQEHSFFTPFAYLCAFACNFYQRKTLDQWLERVVFSAQGAALPFATADFKTRQLDLTPENFQSVLQASCSIPFALKAVKDIEGAPKGAYWDGGITDYQLHLDYRAHCYSVNDRAGLVLYPHFQKQVISGWFDKSLKWRHQNSAFLENTLLLAPNPNWIETLPNKKLPDRSDFARYKNNRNERMRIWQEAVSASQQLSDEFAQWLEKPDLGRIQAL